MDRLLGRLRREPQLRDDLAYQSILLSMKLTHRGLSLVFWN
jgi:hypothetical protein